MLAFHFEHTVAPEGLFHYVKYPFLVIMHGVSYF